jgi:fatty-acyl-CoA synthase
VSTAPRSATPPTPLSTSYWPAERREPLRQTTIGRLLRDAARDVPDRVALVDGQPDPAARRRWTYAELLGEAEAAAQALLARFEPGDRVAVWAANRPEWVVLQLGAGLAGLVLVTVNPAYRAQELEYVLRQSRSVGLVHEAAYRGTFMTAVVDEVRPRLPDLRDVACFDDWDDFLASGRRAEPRPLPEVQPADPVQIQYTSGTTGFAKGALLHHLGAVNAAAFSAERAGFAEGDVWIDPIPLFHVGGSVLTGVGTIVRRGTHVVVPGFEPGLVLELVEAERGNLLLAVPTMLVALLDHPVRPRRDLTSIRTVMSGSSTVPAELVRRTKALLSCDFSILFGQTELHGVLTQTHPTDTDDDQAETIGRPLPQVEVKVADPATGHALPIGEPGEICARGYQAMLGYFELPEATAATLDHDGWLHTGDLGSMDERGYLRITGRLKDIIIRGGENIHPREIEELLSTHPAVGEVAVLGVPDPRWGEQVGAVILPAPGRPSPTPGELHAYCRAHLAAFKTPRVWYFVDELPLTPSGKVQKFVLRERIRAGSVLPRTSDD